MTDIGKIKFAPHPVDYDYDAGCRPVRSACVIVERVLPIIWPQVPIGSNDWWPFWYWQIANDNVSFDEQFRDGTSRFEALQDEE